MLAHHIVTLSKISQDEEPNFQFNTDLKDKELTLVQALIVGPTSKPLD
jgi:hypothetical protein